MRNSLNEKQLKANWIAKRGGAVLLIALVAGFALPAFGDASDHGLGPSNLDFEAGGVGNVPPGWRAGAASMFGFTATVSNFRPHGGNACLEIRRDMGGKSQFCPTAQTIDASPYRGLRVRLSGWARFESDSDRGSARIWIRSDGVPWSYDDLGDKAITSAEWTLAQVFCQVAPDADSIRFGGVLDGHGRAWFDDLHLAIVGRNGDGDQPPRPLSDRGLSNIIAFGRLLGYVRHFHPSDEAAKTNWDTFAVRGVEEVEGATTPQDLKARLERIFQPLAPTLRLGTRPLPKLTPRSLLRASGTGLVGITGWRHLGWSNGAPGSYRSQRVIANADEPGDSLLPIGSDVHTALGAGVWCSVPLTLYRTSAGTAPRGLLRSWLSRRPTGWVPTGADRATRLADILLFWNVIQHFYPLSDSGGLCWAEQLPKALHQAAIDRDGLAFEATLRQLAATLRDGHTGVNSPYTTMSARQWPLECAFVQGHFVVVRADSTLAPTVRLGEAIVAVQGRPIEGWLHEADQSESGASKARRGFMAGTNFFRQFKADTLRLSVGLPGQQSREVVIRSSRTVHLFPARPDSIREVSPGIMYIDLTRVSDADLNRALPKVNAGRGVIFDLRGYTTRIWTSVIAHLTDSVVESLSWGTPVILRPDRKDMSFRWSKWTVNPEKPRIGVPAAFLIDTRAISAAETLLGFVEAYRLASLIGEPTAGTNGNVTTAVLPGGYTVAFTGMKVLKNDGTEFNGRGIQPTISVSPTLRGVASGRDEQLDSAIESLAKSSRDALVR